MVFFERERRIFALSYARRGGVGFYLFFMKKSKKKGRGDASVCATLRAKGLSHTHTRRVNARKTNARKHKRNEHRTTLFIIIIICDENNELRFHRRHGNRDVVAP